jgi:integrase
MHDSIVKAGLPADCVTHGLRKAAGRRLAEAGCSAKQIMSVLGHKTLAEAGRYTKDAEQRRLAADAFAILEEKENKKSQPSTKQNPNPVDCLGRK